MPYIHPTNREHFEDQGIPVPRDGGELQYLIAVMIDSMLCETHLERPIRYADLESIMGALIGAQQEFYREVTSAYEDKKALQNGDVYSKVYI